MSITRPRTRLVYFRITEEEFQQIQRLCEATGARSISDLVRAAIEQFAATGGGAQDDLTRTQEALQQLIGELRVSVQQLTSLAAESATEQKPLATGAQTAQEHS